MDKFLKLLIVDDEPLARKRILSFKLEKHGFKVVGEAGNGKEALRMVSTLKPDIVVTDIVMPVMNGLQLLEELGKLMNPPEVILLTCYDDFSKVQMALRLGAQDYLVKVMLKEEELVRVIKKAAKVIFKKLQTHYKVIRKTLYDLMLSDSDLLFHENARQLKETGFILSFFRLFILEFKTVQMQMLEAHKLSIEKWEGNIGCIVLNMAPKEWIVLLYENKSKDFKSFDEKSCAYCKRLLYDLKGSVTDGKQVPKIILGRVHNGADKLPKAYDCIIPVREELFYAGRNTLIIDEESPGRYFKNMPADKFQEIIDKMHTACMKNNGEGAAQCLLSWFNLVHTKYRPKADEIRIMASLLAACIPADITIPGVNGVFVPVNQWLMEQVESAGHMEEVNSAVKKTSEYLYKFLKCFKGSMRNEIKEALEFIHKNYSKSISLEMTAGHVNLSTSWFNTLFRSETGQTYNSYLVKYRLELAKELLAGTDLSIRQIAGQVGIGDPHYFSRLFAKTLGQSPRAFRKIHIQES